MGARKFLVLDALVHQLWGTEIPLNPPLKKGEDSSLLWDSCFIARQFPPFGKGGIGLRVPHEHVDDKEFKVHGPPS